MQPGLPELRLGALGAALLCSSKTGDPFWSTAGRGASYGASCAVGCAVSCARPCVASRAVWSAAGCASRSVVVFVVLRLFQSGNRSGVFAPAQFVKSMYSSAHGSPFFSVTSLRMVALFIAECGSSANMIYSFLFRILRILHCATSFAAQLTSATGCAIFPLVATQQYAELSVEPETRLG